LQIRVFPPLRVGARREEIMSALTAMFYKRGVDNSVDETAEEFVRESNENS
jgi:hypothetical protein